MPKDPAVRRKSLGGSDAPAALGVSPWKSPLELWGEKTGKLTPPDLSAREEIEFGLKLERIVLGTLAERTGRQVVPWDQSEIVRHPDYAWLTCTPDAMQYEDGRPDGLVEAKTTGAFSAKDWVDEPPLYYQVQLQHNLMVTGCEWGTLAVLIGGQRFRWFDIPRNDTFVSALLEQEQAFWRHVTEDTQPDADGSASCTRALAALYPEDTGEVIDLPDDADRWDERLAAVKQEIKRLSDEKRSLENTLRAAIGDATIGMLPGGGEYTLRTQSRREHVVSASTFRVLRRRK